MSTTGWSRPIRLLNSQAGFADEQISDRILEREDTIAVQIFQSDIALLLTGKVYAQGLRSSDFFADLLHICDMKVYKAAEWSWPFLPQSVENFLKMIKNQAHIFSVAPMMDWTDRHCRAFHRTLTRHALLYTEMVTTKAVIHGDRERLLGYSDVEHPVALQLGGSEPEELAQCARIAEDWGYDEVNLNCGCPSDRVQSGAFGACLMREPELVADGMRAMIEAVSLSVTVKCRIGVDDQEPRDSLFAMVEACRKAGVTSFAVHARKAWLKGLSPKENRDVPPLDYALVYELKRAYPELTIAINGGIGTLEEAQAHLAQGIDGVMLGRAAYHEPALLGQVDRLFFGAGEDIGPFEALEAYRPYMAGQLAVGVPLSHMSRHMLGIMHGLPGARAFRRIMTVDSIAPGAGLEVVDRAIAAVREALAAVEIRRESYEQLKDAG